MSFIGSVAERSSVRKLLLEISQNSEENTCTKVSFYPRGTLYNTFAAKCLKPPFLYIRITFTKNVNPVRSIFPNKGKRIKSKEK